MLVKLDNIFSLHGVCVSRWQGVRVLQSYIKYKGFFGVFLGGGSVVVVVFYHIYPFKHKTDGYNAI